MRRRWIANITVMLISCVVSLALAEGFIRIFRRGDVDTASLARRLESVDVKTMMQPDPDPIIYYGLKPNLRVPWLGTVIFTDARGWRVPVEPQSGLSNSFRLVVLGDSTPFGWNVNFEDTYPDLVRKGLEARLGRPVELINTAVPGYNAWQYERLFETRIVPLKPDLVILHYDHNDLEPTSSFQPSDFLAPGYGDNMLHSALLKFTIRSIRIARNDAQKRRLLGDYERVAEYIVSGRLYDDHLAALGRLAAKARDHSIPVVAVIYNAYVRRDPDYRDHSIYRRLHESKAEFLEASGYHVIDLYPHYQQALEEHGWMDLRDWWNSAIDPLDAHPNPDGHRFIADRVLDGIRELSLH